MWTCKEKTPLCNQISTILKMKFKKVHNNQEWKNPLSQFWFVVIISNHQIKAFFIESLKTTYYVLFTHYFLCQDIGVMFNVTQTRKLLYVRRPDQGTLQLPHLPLLYLHQEDVNRSSFSLVGTYICYNYLFTSGWNKNISICCSWNSFTIISTVILCMQVKTLWKCIRHTKCSVFWSQIIPIKKCFFIFH